MYNLGRGWTTKDEIRYIKHIGETRKASRGGFETVWQHLKSTLAKKAHKKPHGAPGKDEHKGHKEQGIIAIPIGAFQ